MKERTMGRTSVVVLYSRHLEMPRRQSPGVSMPRVGVLRLPSKAPLRAGIACSSLSWFVFAIELNHLPEKSRGETCVHGTVGGHVNIQLIL
jgi:hypothetical protein